MEQRLPQISSMSDFKPSFGPIISNPVRVMTTSLVVAASVNDVIGRDRKLPWHLPEDLRHFKHLTIGHVVVMGRVTYESILARLGHPLPERTSIVISSCHNRGVDKAVLWAPSVESAMAMAQEVEANAAAGEVFVIGGASVYRQALPHVDRIYLTRVHLKAEGDCRMPSNWLEGFRLAARNDRPKAGMQCSYSFLVYTREALWAFTAWKTTEPLNNLQRWRSLKRQESASSALMASSDSRARVFSGKPTTG